MPKKNKIIKSWAVIFPISKDIYETLANGFDLMKQKAIFGEKKSAENWVKKYGNLEARKPKVVSCLIRLNP